MRVLRTLAFMPGGGTLISRRGVVPFVRHSTALFQRRRHDPVRRAEGNGRRNGENLSAGRKLISTQGGTKILLSSTIIFRAPTRPTDRLPSPRRALPALGLITPDYTCRRDFCSPTAVQCQLRRRRYRCGYRRYPPTASTRSTRDGSVGPNQAKNFAGATASIVAPPPPTTVAVIEYYHQGLDHYFMTALASDIAALDAGVFPGWAAHRRDFNAYPTQQPARFPCAVSLFRPSTAVRISSRPRPGLRVPVDGRRRSGAIPQLQRLHPGRPCGVLRHAAGCHRALSRGHGAGVPACGTSASTPTTGTRPSKRS